MITTIIVGVVALVVGAVAGILFTNNNVKKVQATLDYFESELDAAHGRVDYYADLVVAKTREVMDLRAAAEPAPVAKTTKAKKAAS